MRGVEGRATEPNPGLKEEGLARGTEKSITNSGTKTNVMEENEKKEGSLGGRRELCAHLFKKTAMS